MSSTINYNVPKFVQNIMSRAKFDRRYTNKKSNPGYTIVIRKPTAYTYAATFEKELNRLCDWARRHYAEAEILECPKQTRYCNQVALVTITDPVMKRIEKYIKEG